MTTEKRVAAFKKPGVTNLVIAFDAELQEPKCQEDADSYAAAAWADGINLAESLIDFVPIIVIESLVQSLEKRLDEEHRKIEMLKSESGCNDIIRSVIDRDYVQEWAGIGPVVSIKA